MTHFVIPYKIPENPVFGWELMFCLRGIEKYYKDPYDITLIGECPTWLNRSSLNFIENIHRDKNLPIQGKIASHYLIASEIYENFIVIHDDMYMVNECSFDDFKIPKYIEDKLFYSFSDEETLNLNKFQKSIRNTWKILKDNQLPYSKNFIAHYPFFIESDKIKEIHKKFNLTNKYPFENLYYNYFKENGEYIKNYKSGHYYAEDDSINSKAKILNHDEMGFIYQPWIINLLYKLFPEPSKYEISRT